ncbi:MAG: aspartate/glutamate racemase family protein [Pigmentiphaga sp.]
MEAYFGHRARLGLIVPPNNTVSEAEWASALPAGVTLHSMRFQLNPIARTEAELLVLTSGLQSACQLLSEAELNAIAFACTAPSARSPRSEMEALMTASSQLPCATAGAAVVDALKTVSARKVVLISPFSEAVTRHEADFMEQEGINVLSLHSLGHCTYQPGLKLGIHRIAPAQVRDTVLSLDTSGADAIVLSGTNLVTFPVLQEIEANTGRLVISSNQALLWSTLRKAKVEDRLPLGRIFEVA